MVTAIRSLPRRAARLAAVWLPLAAAPAVAQHAGHAGHAGHGAATTDAAMAGALRVNAHLRLSPERPASAADSARVAAVERALLAYLARYEDVRAAEADGFEPFLPNVKAQRVLHFTHRAHAIRAAFAFDPARPTSLLYRRDADGRLTLAGAMYTAPARATDAQLDGRIPLGIARWHQHVDICVPGRGASGRWRELEQGQPRFGPAGAITTRTACDAAGGRFHERIFGWMVHANLVRHASGPRIAWHEEHGH